MFKFAICYERFFICSVTSCFPTWCSLHVLPVPHRAHLVGEGRAREKRGMWLYTLCAWLFESKQGIMFVLFWSGFFFRLSPRSQPGRLREGGSSSVNCDWLEWKFWLIICRLILYLSIVCKCFVTLITAWTAHTIHQSWELSMCCFHICADGDVNGRVNLQFCW